MHRHSTLTLSGIAVEAQDLHFPTDSHVNGFQSFLYYKLEAERRNFNKNFVVEQYNRNREFKDHIKTEDEIQYN